MIGCRKFDDPDCDKSLRTHVGRNLSNYEVHHGITRITMSCTVVYTTECHDSSLEQKHCDHELLEWTSFVLLRTLSCGRTRWLVTVDVDIPFPCCTCLSWISGRIRVQESVRSAANSQPAFSRHIDDRVRAERLRLASVPNPGTRTLEAATSRELQ